ncbi:MAG TPA: GyrI-like domain-containing protein [Myxococcota bacterium]|nr:GyrI-like domain-containing protein [Myxococcota bacterium]HOD08282.1 GyrI-like domain-containing protein [Myxococcota bacterium]HPB50941.1 GyrI-like domain-containing protein [Myxococcota bacterium]HQP95955.1 GyrI-like domain-containing protein [Myxococcota bacterium]
MKSGASRLSSGLVLFLALSVLSAVGCKGCGDKDDELVVTTTVARTEQPGYSSGLPPAPPQPVEITPDSPLDKQAVHYGMSLDELLRLKEAHLALPGIPVPAGTPQPNRKLKQVEKPLDGEIPYESDQIEGGRDRVIQLPAFKVIIATEMPDVTSADQAQIHEALTRLRQLLFNVKVPVFSKPVAFVDSTLEKPESPCDLSIGFPVPADLPVPKGMKVREVAGSGLYAGHMRIAETQLTAETWKALTSPEFKALFPQPCVMSIVAPFDQAPDGVQTPMGNGFFYCRK